MAFSLREDDGGTKKATGKAVEETEKKLAENFVEACKEYWFEVWQTARRLCLEYGVYDTGTLYDSIRLIWEVEPTGGVYEVAVSSQGAEITAMIKVGGTEYINPKTGTFVDYAQAVHDGHRTKSGGWVEGRPFLMDAIELCQPLLDQILAKYTDDALSRFVREY